MKEIWKPVFRGFYEISNLGRVRSVTRTTKDGRTWRGRILRPAPSGNTRLMFCACIEGRRRSPCLHSLVAKAFLGRRPRGMEINHKDGDYKNNRADNLEYITRSANKRHAVVHGLMPSKKNGLWRRKWRP